MFSHPSDSDPHRESSLDAIRVPKWPFWIADGVLVTFAFMLFVQADGQPGSATLLLAVIAVTVGAIAFVTPYLFELLLRYRFLSDRWDDMGATTPLETRLKQSETHFETLRKVQKQFSSETAAQAESFQHDQQRLALRIQELEQALTQATDFAAKALDSRTDELQQTVQWLTPQIEKMEKQLQDLAYQYQQDRASLMAEKVDPLPVSSESSAMVSSSKPEEAPKESPPSAENKPGRPRRGLLHRAMEQGNGSGDTPAVKRIIGRTFSPRSEPSEINDLSGGKLDPEAVPDAATEEASEEIVVIAPNTQSTASEKPSITDSGAGEADANAQAIIENGEESPLVSEQKSKEGQTSSVEVPEASLFPEMTPTPRRAAKPKSSETVVLARVLIGIGNKPYIRGDLPGLNLGKGIAMDFREIGVWQWVSSEVETSGKIRIFRNDEEPEQAAFHEIDPGQHLEIQPRFPKQTD